MQRWLVACIVVCLPFVQPVQAAELSMSGELKGFTTRLLAESTDLATTPFSLKDGNLFWTIGIAGAIGLTYAYDGDIRDKLQANRSKGLNKATDAGALIGSPYLHLGAAALVYGGGILADSPKWKQSGEMLMEAVILADTATLLIKEGTGRGRPQATNRKDDFRPFQFKADYDAFPSMHTASSFALASVVSRTSDSIPIAVLSYTAATFVGFSRMYQNKHWASDVLLAAAIGELSGRVVTSLHASQDKDRRLVFVPAVSNTAAGMHLLYRF